MANRSPSCWRNWIAQACHFEEGSGAAAWPTADIDSTDGQQPPLRFDTSRAAAWLPCAGPSCDQVQRMLRREHSKQTRRVRLPQSQSPRVRRPTQAPSRRRAGYPAALDKSFGGESRALPWKRLSLHPSLDLKRNDLIDPFESGISSIFGRSKCARSSCRSLVRVHPSRLIAQARQTCRHSCKCNSCRTLQRTA